jgi:flagellar biosynthesis protein
MADGLDHKGKTLHNVSLNNKSTPPDKTAVALAYNPDEVAPKIIASGKGYLADKILQKAKENQIPVHQDEKLVSTLSKLKIGDYIPPELYEVVSEILVFVDNMDRIKSKVFPKGE